MPAPRDKVRTIAARKSNRRQLSMSVVHGFIPWDSDTGLKPAL
jgi:hypothetical protein